MVGSVLVGCVHERFGIQTFDGCVVSDAEELGVSIAMVTDD